jgi:hypothetical protein
VKKELGMQRAKKSFEECELGMVGINRAFWNLKTDKDHGFDCHTLVTLASTSFSNVYCDFTTRQNT